MPLILIFLPLLISTNQNNMSNNKLLQLLILLKELRVVPAAKLSKISFNITSYKESYFTEICFN